MEIRRRRKNLPHTWSWLGGFIGFAGFGYNPSLKLAIDISRILKVSVEELFEFE